MRRLLTVVLLSSLLAGCGGGDDDTTGDTAGAGSTDGGSDASGSTLGGAVPNPEADVDCAVLRDEDKLSSLVGLQLIPQMTRQSVIDTMRTSSAPIDPDAMLEYLEALRPLGGRDYEPFGDPADAIEHYITATIAARDLLAVDGPVPQEQLDAYVALVGDPAEFLRGQIAMGAALDETCPE